MDVDEANMRLDRRELKAKVQENAQVQKAHDEQMKAQNERHFNHTQVRSLLVPHSSSFLLSSPPSSSQPLSFQPHAAVQGEPAPPTPDFGAFFPDEEHAGAESDAFGGD